LAADSLSVSSILLPCAIGVLISIGLEQCLRPRPRLIGRPLSAWCLHLGLWMLAFAFELLLFHRPYFAVFNILAFVLLVILVSNAKWSSLGEPFVYQDFEYFLDAIKHPRLYLPFFGPWLAVTLAVLFALLFYAGLRLEEPLRVARFALEHWLFLFVMGIVGVSFVWLGSRVLTRRHRVALDTNTDLQNLGMVASAWRYRQLERQPISNTAMANNAFMHIDAQTGPNRSHIVVVQSESFFDARRLFSGVHKDVLKHWDAMKRESVMSGLVRVAAWGANTVRTEFAFLAGIKIQSLGIHQFNPYRKFARQGIATIATELKNQGYRTICVHPYPASFYSRDRVFPLLGFDEFMDIESFSTASKVGPYVGDDAVAEKIIKVLDNASQPTFVFAITMENHGPLHWESVGADETAALFERMPPTGCEDLAVYVRHLRNADRMVARLTAHLRLSARAAWLCLYGDHVPIMPKVYQALGAPDGTTDYCIWGNPPAIGDVIASAPVDIDISDLAACVLRRAGVARH
jgi:Sulfatase